MMPKESGGEQQRETVMSKKERIGSQKRKMS
jgi:hypothetical protein